MGFGFLLIVLCGVHAVFASFSVRNSSITAKFEMDSVGYPVWVQSEDHYLGTDHSWDPLLRFACNPDSMQGTWTVHEWSYKINIVGQSVCYEGLDVNQTRTVVGRELVVSLQVSVRQPIEVKQGLAILVGQGVQKIEAANHSVRKQSYALTQKPLYVQLNQRHWLFDSSNRAMCLWIPNPFHAFLRSDSLQNVWLDLLPRLPAYSNESKEGSWSRLIPGDTLFRELRFSLDQFPKQQIAFSEHPQGNAHTVTMYLDELPNRDNWETITTSLNENTPVYSQFVRLLERFPSMRLGLLLLTDRDVHRHRSHFDGWETNHYQILPDTLVEFEGDACVHFKGMQSTDSLVMRQVIETFPVDTLRVALSHLKNGDGNPKVCIKWDDLPRQCQILQSDSIWKQDTLEWSLKSFERNTSWTLEIESRGSGDLWLDQVMVLDPSYGTLLDNGGFERYRATYLYDNPRRHWSDAHGKEFVPDAPPHYKTFLQRIENNVLRHGWEDRVSLGFHGLKHTSEINRPDPEHEFSFYDPWGDSLRLQRIFEQFYAVGLTQKSLRYIRPPGWRQTRSLVHQLVERGVVWMDPGWWNSNGVNSGFFLIRNGNMLWGRSSDWWLDRNELGWKLGEWDFWNALELGHQVHLGGHPEAMMYDSNSYAAHEALFSKMEKEYPHLGYLQADEYADHATAVSKLRLLKEMDESRTFVHVKGTIPKGLTLLFWGYLKEEIVEMMKGYSQVQMREKNGVFYVWFTQAMPKYAGALHRFRYRPIYEVNGRSTQKKSVRKIYIQRHGTEIRMLDF